MYLSLLQKHIPMAAEMIEGELPIPDEWEGTLDLEEICCKIGVSVKFYEAHRHWLDEEEGRRLFFIEERAGRLAQLVVEMDAVLLLNDQRVKIFYLETPLQKEGIAQRIGALASFRKLSIVGEEWRALLEKAHRDAELLASNVADFGALAYQHQKQNYQRLLKPFSELKDSKKGTPAIVCGAGPSFDRKTIPNAFIIKAGSANNYDEIKPHLRVALCPHNPIAPTHLDTPLVIQGRVHPDSVQGEEIFYLPDSLDTGWTTANGAVAIAAFLGCNPIYMVGMDLCYSGQEKYAGEALNDLQGLVTTLDREGNEVLTQRDWLASLDWFRMFAHNHPELSFYNATSKGLSIGNEQPLPSFSDAKIEPLSCSSIVPQRVPLPKIEELFDQIWPIWKPLFERELMADRQPLSIDEKLALQKELFFSQVKEELSELNGKITTRMDDGTILSEQNYEKGVRNGECRHYYSSGKLYRQERFLHGKKEGIQRAFYESGSLKTEEHYKNGFREGPQRLYWENGTLKREGFFVRNLREGKEQFWSAEGTLLDEGQYEKGKAIGSHRRYQETGQLLEEIEHLDHKRWNYHCWDKTGQLRAKIEWKSLTEYEELKWTP